MQGEMQPGRAIPGRRKPSTREATACGAVREPASSGGVFRKEGLGSKVRSSCSTAASDDDHLEARWRICC